MTGEGRNAIFHRDADMGGVDAGFERQLVDYVLLDSEARWPRGV
jgi:hypothetical protein